MMEYCYSMFSWFGYCMSFEDRIKIIADAGFEEAMISWEDELADWEMRKEDFPKIVRDHGLKITNIHLPFRGYNDIWEESQIQIQGKLEKFKGYVKECHDFEIPVMVLHTCDLEDLKPDLDKGKAFFSELADAGEKYGIGIAVENVSRQYLLTYLLDEIDAPHFGMCYDSSHDFLEKENSGHILRKYKNRIKALHLSDNDFEADRHWIPGEGKIPFKEVMDEILTVPTIKSISYEVCANEIWRKKDPSEFAEAVLKSLKK